MPSSPPSGRQSPPAVHLCSVTGCRQPVSRYPWSALCDKHSARQYRTGTTRLDSMRRGELAKYRERISFVLDKYGSSKAVDAAVMLADDFLQWKPRGDFTNHYRLAAQMQRLKEGGCTAREFLQRVCEVWALQAFDQRFANERELLFALSRGVLYLRPQGTSRPAGPLLKLLGRELLADLGKFAAGVCMRIEKDDEVRAGAKKAFEQWTMRGEEGTQ